MVDRKKSHNKKGSAPLTVLLNEIDVKGDKLTPSKVDRIIDRILDEADRLMPEIRSADLIKVIDIKKRSDDAKNNVEVTTKFKFKNIEAVEAEATVKGTV